MSKKVFGREFTDCNLTLKGTLYHSTPKYLPNYLYYSFLYKPRSRSSGESVFNNIKKSETNQSVCNKYYRTFIHAKIDYNMSKFILEVV
jgi:hypothetical protein